MDCHHSHIMSRELSAAHDWLLSPCSPIQRAQAYNTAAVSNSPESSRYVKELPVHSTPLYGAGRNEEHYNTAVYGHMSHDSHTFAILYTNHIHHR